jgi:alkyl sulfatase BDS1-like metallo-beta-lactamase superfamily hydrolase
MIRAMTIEQVFDTIAVRVMSEQVGGINAAINWTFDDLTGTSDHRWVLGMSNRTLYSVRGRHEVTAAASVRTTRRTFLEVIAQTTTFVDEMGAGNVTVEGDAQALLDVFANLDVFESGFAVVEP